MRDAVPSEARDASLTLGKTRRGRSAGQEKNARQDKRGVARQDKKGCSAGQRKGAWQEGARDIFEKALGLRFGLTVILA